MAGDRRVEGQGGMSADRLNRIRMERIHAMAASSHEEAARQTRALAAEEYKHPSIQHKIKYHERSAAYHRINAGNQRVAYTNESVNRAHDAYWNAHPRGYEGNDGHF